MGQKFSKMKKYCNLHIVTYNYNNNNSNLSNNILENFINNFLNKDVIICIQDINHDIKINKLNNFYSENLKLLILTNLNILKKEHHFYDSNNYNLLNKNLYGFQHLKLCYHKIKLNIYNTEIIPDEIQQIDFDKIRNKQVKELFDYICKSNDRIHLVVGTFFEYDNNIKELINISEINNLITNFNNNKQESYIFAYTKNIVNNIDDINNYLKNKYHMRVVNHKIYNLEIDEYCPFEVILKIEKINIII
jgi:hypothetical protein|tara:strand:+ start:1970 stop:2713 length:744 start_codon:yes stop_codon:yes gene_type:complete